MHTQTYLFELGRQPDLSIAEIFSYAHMTQTAFTIRKQTTKYLIVEAQTPVDPKGWMQRLGGTIKIGVAALSGNNLEEQISGYLEKTEPEGKITFSLSGPNAKRTALSIKKTLKNRGRSVRYVEAKNTATILHNRLVEKHSDLTIVENQVFVTEAIQDIEAFGERDYGRPGRAARRGMLPPKLARIMLNLSELNTEAILLDPFCGSGTVLMEAALMGYTHLVGSDASPEAVEDTKKSLDWLKQTYALQTTETTIYLSDAQKINSTIDSGSVDGIVSEPYLGKPLSGNEEKHMLQKQAADLKTLYINAFKAFYHTLKPGGVIVFVIPAFRHKQDWVRIDIEKNISNIGFKSLPLNNMPHLLYARNNQHVGREIWKWQKI